MRMEDEFVCIQLLGLQSIHDECSVAAAAAAAAASNRCFEDQQIMHETAAIDKLLLSSLQAN